MQLLIYLLSAGCTKYHCREKSQTLEEGHLSNNMDPRIILLFVCSAYLTVNSEALFNGHKVLGVAADTPAAVKLLQELQEEFQLDFWNEVSSQRVTYIDVMPENVGIVEKILADNGLSFFVKHDDLQRVVDDYMTRNAHEGNIVYADPAEFNLTKYHNLGEIYQFLQDLADSIPDVSVTDIGRTLENRTLKLLKFGVGDKPAIFIEAGIHAREWIAPAVVIYFIYQLAYEYGVDPEVTALRDNYDWHFLVSTNPDGYDFTWTENRLWRKNRSKYGSCYGVDLNRNFDHNFGGEGTSNVSCSETYHGPNAFSEAETQSVRDYVTPLAENIALYVGFHSYSQYWLIPYSYTSNSSADNDKLMALSQIGVDALFSVYGTVFTNGPWYSVLYVSSGTSLDWGYDKLSIDTIFTIELRDTGENGFLLPEEQISPSSIETWHAIKAVLAAL